MELELEGAGTPLEEAEVERFERELGVRLPDNYRMFLLETNGGRPVENWEVDLRKAHEAGGVTIADFFGLDVEDYADLRWNSSAYGIEWNASGLLPIAEDGNGNFLCLSLRGDDFGAVLFFDHELGPHGPLPSPECMTPLTRSFTELIEALRPIPDEE